MNYFVIDSENIPSTDTRVEAEKLKEDLLRDNPEQDWQVVVKAEFTEDNPLEKLYALTANLLQMTGADPLRLGLELHNLDGSAEFISALQIMNQSRQWLDATEIM